MLLNEMRALDDKRFEIRLKQPWAGLGDSEMQTPTGMIRVGAFLAISENVHHRYIPVKVFYREYP